MVKQRIDFFKRSTVIIREDEFCSCLCPSWQNFYFENVEMVEVFIQRRSKVSQHSIICKDRHFWWHSFLPLYNGVSMMLYEEWCSPDAIFSSDSSLQACGGFWDGKYFHSKFPAKVTDRGYSINILEMLAIIVCLKLWGKFYVGK